MNGTELLSRVLSPLLTDVRAVDDENCWRPTRCAGWVVRDLIFHLLTDVQRGLVALHTPAPGPPDVDAVSYWADWQPGTAGADAFRRNTRILASVWSSALPLATLYNETADALLRAAGESSTGDVVATQGHAIAVDDLLSTLAVEATVHHLDLRGRPSPDGLAEVRRVLDGLLGFPGELDDDVRYALVGTDREPPDELERTALGDAAGRLPLFG